MDGQSPGKRRTKVILLEIGGDRLSIPTRVTVAMANQIQLTATEYKLLYELFK